MSMSKNRWQTLALALLLSLHIPFAAVSESLLPEELRVPEAVNENTALVRRDRFVKTANGSAVVVYPKTVQLYIEEGEGIFEAFLVRKGVEVKAGDVLATFSREPQTVQHETLKLSLSRAEEALIQGIATRDEAIQAARARLVDINDPLEREIALIQLEKQRLAKEKFILQQERSIERLRTQLDELEALLADNCIVAPFDGIIESVVAKSAGDVIRANEKVITMYSPDAVLVRVTDSNMAFRYGMETTITGGSRNDPQVVQGQVVAASNVLPYELRQQAAYIAVTDTPEIAELRNLSASVETIVLEDVLVVTRNALTMQGGMYYAEIVAEDMVQKRYVLTSSHRLTDLLILQGLEEGQSVLVD